MAFEWDIDKATANLQKHQVDFADAASIFEDEYALTTHQEPIDIEPRYATIGMDLFGQLL